MSILFKLAVVSLMGVSAGTSLAGECEMTVDRHAMPGKEAEMTKPYKGVNPTVEKKKADSEADCEKIAVKACGIIRKDIIASKIIKAKFDGKDIKGGADHCK